MLLPTNQNLAKPPPGCPWYLFFPYYRDFTTTLSIASALPTFRLCETVEQELRGPQNKFLSFRWLCRAGNVLYFINIYGYVKINFEMGK
jgi:hypothetical protein